MRLFRLKSSLQGSISLIFVFTLTIVMVSILPIQAPAKLVLAGMLLLLAFYYLRRDIWRLLPTSFVHIRLDGDQMVFIRRSGAELRGKVAGSSFVTPLLTIVNIKSLKSWRLSSVILFSDSMSREDFRQLRVLLKWNRDAVL